MTKCLLIYRPSYDEEEGYVYLLDSVCLSQEEVDVFLSKHAKYKSNDRTAFKVVEYETGSSIDYHYSYSEEEDRFHPKCPTCGMTYGGIGYIVPIDEDMWFCKNGHKWPMEWFVEYDYLDGTKKT